MEYYLFIFGKYLATMIKFLEENMSDLAVFLGIALLSVLLLYGIWLLYKKKNFEFIYSSFLKAASVVLPLFFLIFVANSRKSLFLLNDYPSIAFDSRYDSLQKKITDLNKFYKDSVKIVLNNILNNGKKLDNDELKSYVDIQISKLSHDISNQREITEGLREAINPISPDEVLTIARLKDQINLLNKSSTDLSENLKQRQQTFEEAVRREISATNSSTNIILVVMIPLVLNFSYNVWKDNRKPREDQTKSPSSN